VALALPKPQTDATVLGLRSRRMGEAEIKFLYPLVIAECAAGSSLTHMSAEFDSCISRPLARTTSPSPIPSSSRSARLGHTCQMMRLGPEVAETLEYEPDMFTVQHNVRGHRAYANCQKCRRRYEVT